MFKKFVATALITSQIGLASGAWAAQLGPTPELNLFRTSIALAGQNLSNEELQARLADAFGRYEKTAQPDGQADRIEQALVTLRMYTPEQAHELALDAKEATARISADSQSQAEATQAASRELMTLASKYPAGAQFTGCELGYGEGVAGGMGMLMGGLFWATSSSNVNGDLSTNDRVHLPHDLAIAHFGEVTTYASLGALVLGIITYTLDKNCQ